MAQIKFNEDGVLVNAETGEAVGRSINGNVVIDSADAEVRTLEEMGVSLPREPTQEELDHQFDPEYWVSARKALSSADPKPSSSSSSSGDMAPPVSAVPASPETAGPTSFPVKRTKYEVTPESYFVVKFGLIQHSDGHFSTVSIDDSEMLTYKSVEQHWVKFRMWTYAEEMKWKNDCLEYHPASKQQFINYDKLNERKIRCLMLDWSFGGFEDRLKLLHCDGRLSDESYAVFCGLMPVIANSIVNLMNNVLEGNQ